MALDPKEVRRTLGFEKNEVFDAVLAYMDSAIAAEVDRAISYSIEGEKRVHACGRAEALRDFRDLLLAEQSEALRERFGVKNSA
jgi:predicted ester cyclase